MRDFLGVKGGNGHIPSPHRLLVSGEWIDSTSGRTFGMAEPATGDPLAEVAEGDAYDLDQAVGAVRRAFEEDAWPKLSPSERGKLVWKLGDLLLEHLDELAQFESLDVGKSAVMAGAADVPLSADLYHYMAGWATKIEDNTTSFSVPPGAEYFPYTVREPVGVVGEIIPWNFPLLMAAWKLGPALATGNTVVLKPPEETPLSALPLGELIKEAGFSPGVVNIVTGYGETAGAALAAHPEKVEPLDAVAAQRRAHKVPMLSTRSSGSSPSLDVGPRHGGTACVCTVALALPGLRQRLPSLGLIGSQHDDSSQLRTQPSRRGI